MLQGDRRFLDDYAERLRRATAMTDDVVRAIAATRDLWHKARAAGGRVMFLGNGGSAAICSHLANDLSKAGRTPATCFNDAALITCLANDYGHDNWMARAIELNGRPGDVAVVISSSGRSRNILNAAKQAQAQGLDLVTLSGMAPDNPLRGMGSIRFWCDSRAYNIVETTHQFWMMAAIDLLIGQAEYPSS